MLKGENRRKQRVSVKSTKKGELGLPYKKKEKKKDRKKERKERRMKDEYLHEIREEKTKNPNYTN